jgi:hypothetical protein
LKEKVSKEVVGVTKNGADGVLPLLEEIPQNNLLNKVKVSSLILTRSLSDRTRRSFAAIGVGVHVETVVVEGTLTFTLVKVSTGFHTGNKG